MENADLALGFADQEQNISTMLGSDRLQRVNGVWSFRDGALEELEAACVFRVLQAGQNASVATAGILYARREDHENLESLVLDNPLESATACEIAFHGWSEYLRRYGSITIDTVDDFENKIVEVLAESLKSKRRCFISTRYGKTLFAVEVPVTCETCAEALDYALNNHKAVSQALQRRQAVNKLNSQHVRKVDFS